MNTSAAAVIDEPPFPASERSATSSALLEVANLKIVSTRPNSAPAIEGVSLRLVDGQIGLLVGRSGVGKSLLFRAILGLLAPEEWTVTGKISICGQAVLQGGLLGESSGAETIRRDNIGAVFQSPSTHLHPSLSIGWQVSEAAWREVRNDRWRYWRYSADTEKRFDEVGLPRDFAERRRDELSGGQQQRAMIACALGSSILLADEPTSALDEKAEGEIIALLKRCRAEQGIRSMLIITHNPSAFIYHLYDTDAESHDRKRADQIWTIERQPGDQTSTVTEPISVSEYDNHGRSVERPGHQEDLLLIVDGVSIDIPQGWRRAPKRILENVSFGIRRGGISYISGPSGCGKTTLARAILGLQPCTEGRIVLRSQRDRDDRGSVVEIDLSSTDQRTEARRLVQMVFQDSISTFNPRMTIRETFREIIDNDDAIRNRVIDVGFVAPDDVLDRFPSQFSGGECQRLGIARALLREPKLVIADEPFSNQDEETACELAHLFAQLAEEKGVTFIVISHDLRLLRELCHGGIEFVIDVSSSGGQPGDPLLE